MPDDAAASGERQVLRDEELAAFRRDGFRVSQYRLPARDRSGRNDFTRGHPQPRSCCCRPVERPARSDVHQNGFMNA